MSSLSECLTKRLLGCAAGLVLTATAAAGPAEPPCHAVGPADWQPLSVRWVGECPDGHAEGLGVLRGLAQGKVVRLYFGRMQAGQPQIGVVEQADGYVAGRFEHGVLLPSDAREDYVLAFTTASAAAEAASQRFSQAGNAASAHFYHAKARRLAEQMD